MVGHVGSPPAVLPAYVSPAVPSRASNSTAKNPSKNDHEGHGRAMLAAVEVAISSKSTKKLNALLASVKAAEGLKDWQLRKLLIGAGCEPGSVAKAEHGELVARLHGLTLARLPQLA